MLQRLGPEGCAGVGHIGGDRAAGVGVHLTDALNGCESQTAVLLGFAGQADHKTDIGLDVGADQIGNGRLDILSPLIFGHQVKQPLGGRLGPDIQPLTVTVSEPVGKPFPGQQVDPHLPAPGHIHLLHQFYHHPGTAKEVIIGVVNRLQTVVLLQPRDLPHDHLVRVHAPGPLHDDLIVTKTTAEGTAPRDIDRDRFAIGATSNKVERNGGE